MQRRRGRSSPISVMPRSFRTYWPDLPKVAALQVVHGALFGVSQSNANKWIRVLLLALDQTLRDLGDAPARHLRALEQRLAAVQASAGSASPFFS
jgi:hypothetical protein